MMSWTEEKVNKLKELGGKGQTAAKLQKLSVVFQEMQLLERRRLNFPQK